MSKKKSLISFAFGVVILLVIIGNWKANEPIKPSPAESHQATNSPAKPISTRNVGDDGILVNSAGKSALVGVDESAYSEIQKAFAVSDSAGYLELLTSGKAFAVANGTKIKVIDRGYGKRRVRILEGDMFTRSGWVPLEWVQ